jgi:hypothetical protein
MASDRSTEDSKDPGAFPFLTLAGLPLHTRSLTVSISRRTGSVWHARGDIVDLRKNGFVPTSYDIQPSGIIHSMSIELDFDPDSLEIYQIAVDQPFIAVDPSPETEGECCRDPAPRLLDFKGDHLDPGFTKRLSAHFGGPLGCSHLLTLFQLMASTIPLGVAEEQERMVREGSEARFEDRFFRRSVFIDGHLRSDNRVDTSIQLADTHTRPLQPGGGFIERLESSHEWKILASIERKRFQIEALSARERRRLSSSVGTASWVDHDALLAPLVSTPIIPGLAGRIFKLLPESTSSGSLRDSLLQLAPGFIQIVAALMDDYFEARAQAEQDGAAPKAEVNAIGGNSNSCYMWRADSPISKSWKHEREATGN